MKFAVVGKDTKEIESELLGIGFVKDQKKPDVVFSAGGDGTILYSEHKYPSVPKVSIRKSRICKKCVFDKGDLKKIIDALKKKNYAVKEYVKLEADISGKTLYALNEIQVHNASPAKAIRFSVSVDKKLIEKEVIGDGIVVSTPYGSGAYYYSIGGKAFEKGIGIGFNNPHARIKNLVVPEESVVEIKILRGHAIAMYDNSDNTVALQENKVIRIKKCRNPARFVIV